MQLGVLAVPQFIAAALLLTLPVLVVAEDHLPAKTLSKIRVERKHHGFVDAAGKPFMPFGVTYYRPGTGWAPQLWKQFDAEATRRDFARLKRQGANVVRVFISFGSFFTEPGKLNPEGLSKFDQLLDLADEAGLYVHPTGPDGWEGMPEWTKDLNVFSNDGNEPCLKALERLRSHKSLETLALGELPITKEQIDFMQSLPKLRVVDLEDSNVVSEADRQKLRMELPNVRIQHNALR